MLRRAFAVCAVVIAAVSCRDVLGLGDPLPYGPDGGLSPNGEPPVVTEDNSACGANLVVDSEHCGRCGHSCRGSRCERGKCVPLGVVPADAPIFSVVDGRVYTVASQNIVRAEATADAGSAPPVFIIIDKALVGPTPRALIANASHVVWSGETGVRVCNASGCGGDGPELLSAAEKTGPVARVADVHPTFPYLWANFQKGTVEKYGSAVPLSIDTRVDGALCPAAFAGVDGGAYLSDAPGKRIWLYRATETGRIAATVDDVCAIAASGNNVFYTDAANVWRTAINPDGTLAPRVPIASNVVAPKVVATDDAHVYWAASTPETAIVRCRLTGCEGPPEIVVDAIPPIDGLVVEGPFVYFSVFLNDTLKRIIYKVAK